MSASKVLRCPSCRATSDDVEFTATVAYRAYGSAIVAVNPDGKLVLDFMDRGDPDWLRRPRLYCGGCGHDWPTTREWVHGRVG